MEGIPISEIAKRLNIKPLAAKLRLYRRDIHPIGYIGPTGLYNEDVVELIREDIPRGKKAPKYGKNRDNTKAGNNE